MTDYQGNSHKSKPQEIPEKKVEKVVTGEVIQKKKSFSQKFKSVFLGGELKGATRYVVADVVYPALRDLVFNSVTRGADRMIYGESATQRRRPPVYGSRIQYNSPVRRDRPYLPDQPPHSVARQVRRETNDLVLATREEAETVLERMFDIISKYEVASLADLYELTGLPTSPIDNKWGWTYLNNTEIRQVRDGYLLDLPPAEEI